MSRRRRSAVAVLVALALLGACGGDGGPATLRIYTSVTQDTVDAVVAGFETSVSVEVFRAPTGELTARLAAEQRTGGVQADVLWLTDPLSMQQYAADGLLHDWVPEAAAAVPAELRGDAFWGTRILNLVIVHRPDLASPPQEWSDLAGLAGTVAIPDPGFAGSAFGALAAFALDPAFGMDFYRELAAAGAVQVRSPGEVLNGVAEGQYAAGITLDKVARDAIADGAPVTLVWPASGAVTIYSPIAVVADREAGDAARAFVDHVLSPAGQAAIAATGWQPVRADIAWERGGPQITVDWPAAFERRDDLLAAYRAIFGG